MNRLKPMPHANAWRNTCLALEKSLAPMKWATCTEKPTDTAERMEPISHVVVSIRPMLADCAAPRCPTMAASMKNIITVVIWASIDGMLKSMKTLLDVHTHTIASGHAYSTLQEMAKAAKDKGLEILGITEHGPNIPGTCDPLYFRNLHCVPRDLYGLQLMLGAELNILNTQGDIDLDETYWRMLDIRIAGIHSLCWQGGTKAENTRGVINAMRNPYIQIISHPGDGTAELDFDALMRASKETHTLLEINNHSMAPIRHKTIAAPNNLELLRLAKKYETPVIFGSDAHFYTMIADYGNIMPLVEKAQFPDELVINYNPEKFKAYIKPMPQK